MVTKQPRLGQGVQWNTGGWFGAQLGSTLWVLIAALVLLPKHPVSGIIALSSFALPNIFGLMLYRNRNRLAPYPAIQWLVFVIGIFTVSFVVYLDRLDLVQEIDPRLGSDRWGFYLVPVLFAGLMFLFHVVERKARKRPTEGNTTPK
jgi:hypothetical protein